MHVHLAEPDPLSVTAYSNAAINVQASCVASLGRDGTVLEMVRRQRLSKPID